jgi:hypothetical protein
MCSLWRAKFKNIRGKMKKLSDTTISQIITLYQQGKTPIQLAIQFGIANNSVTRLLRNHGIARTQLIRFSRSPETDKIIVDEYMSGISSTIIAEKHNSNEKTIRRVLRENNVKIRPSSRNQRTPKINENSLETMDSELLKEVEDNKE